MKPLYHFDNEHSEWPAKSKNICSLDALFGQPKTTTTTSPWSSQAPYLQDIFGQAQNLYQNNTPQYYPGSTVAPFNATENNALTDISKLGNNDSTTNSAVKFNNDLLSGKYLNSDPYKDDTAQSVLSSVLPQVTSQFVNNGSMGNPSAAYAAAQGATSALAPIEYQNYQNNMDNMIKGEALSPQIQGMQYQDYTNKLGAGQAIQGQQQNDLTDQVNRFNFNQQVPYQKLQQYLQSVGGNYGSTQTSQQSSNPLSSIMGLLATPQFGSLFSGGSSASGGGGGAASDIGALSSLFAFL